MTVRGKCHRGPFPSCGTCVVKLFQKKAVCLNRLVFQSSHRLQRHKVVGSKNKAKERKGQRWKIQNLQSLNHSRLTLRCGSHLWADTRFWVVCNQRGKAFCSQHCSATSLCDNQWRPCRKRVTSSRRSEIMGKVESNRHRINTIHHALHLFCLNVNPLEKWLKVRLCEINQANQILDSNVTFVQPWISRAVNVFFPELCAVQEQHWSLDVVFPSGTIFQGTSQEWRPKRPDGIMHVATKSELEQWRQNSSPWLSRKAAIFVFQFESFPMQLLSISTVPFLLLLKFQTPRARIKTACFWSSNFVRGFRMRFISLIGTHVQRWWPQLHRFPRDLCLQLPWLCRKLVNLNGLVRRSLSGRVTLSNANGQVIVWRNVIAASKLRKRGVSDCNSEHDFLLFDYLSPASLIFSSQTRDSPLSLLISAWAYFRQPRKANWFFWSTSLDLCLPHYRSWSVCFRYRSGHAWLWSCACGQQIWVSARVLLLLLSSSTDWLMQKCLDLGRAFREKRIL